MSDLEERTDADAEQCFRECSRKDPFFKEIPPALLNSNDIRRYIEKTGMLHPYSEENLKSASYSICIGKRVIYWDNKGQHQDKTLQNGEVFELPPNSIVFIQTMETFRLPDYMAIRFDLKIDAVHKGILLGTGPLVDPGYAGTLLIPLHNLTTNTYYFHCGQRFVWVEFTKVSSYYLWEDQHAKSEERKYSGNDGYKEFPKNKKHLKPHEYLANAHSGVIRSSIPDVLERAQGQARQATIISWSTMIGVVALIISVFFGASEIVQLRVKEAVKSDKYGVGALQQEIETLRTRVGELEKNTSDGSQAPISNVNLEGEQARAGGVERVSAESWTAN